MSVLVRLAAGRLCMEDVSASTELSTDGGQRRSGDPFLRFRRCGLGGHAGV